MSIILSNLFWGKILHKMQSVKMFLNFHPYRQETFVNQSLLIKLAQGHHSLLKLKMPFQCKPDKLKKIRKKESFLC